MAVTESERIMTRSLTSKLLVIKTDFELAYRWMPVLTVGHFVLGGFHECDTSCTGFLVARMPTATFLATDY